MPERDHDPGFAQQCIRGPLRHELASKTEAQRQQFWQYVSNVRQSVTEVFAPAFLAGQASLTLKSLLKQQHAVLMTGQSVAADALPALASANYHGHTAFRQELRRLPPGIMLHEDTMSQLARASVELKGPRAPQGLHLNAPLPEIILLRGIAQPLEELEFRRGKPNTLFSSTRPKNRVEPDGRVIHEFPRFHATTQSIYLQRMATVMQVIEVLATLEPRAAQANAAIEPIAEYYHLGINAHLFERCNNSLLMSQVNWLLAHFGLTSIAHQLLDYQAFSHHTEGFIPLFNAAVLHGTQKEAH
ncbi:MAG: hypothetical protein QM776_00450 [Rhodocyclaceae bacterium]